jgi:hypothetical protein
MHEFPYKSFASRCGRSRVARSRQWLVAALWCFAAYRLPSCPYRSQHRPGTGASVFRVLFFYWKDQTNGLPDWTGLRSRKAHTASVAALLCLIVAQERKRHAAGNCSHQREPSCKLRFLLVI